VLISVPFLNKMFRKINLLGSTSWTHMERLNIRFNKPNYVKVLICQPKSSID